MVNGLEVPSPSTVRAAAGASQALRLAERCLPLLETKAFGQHPTTSDPDRRARGKMYEILESSSHRA